MNKKINVRLFVVAILSTVLFSTISVSAKAQEAAAVTTEVKPELQVKFLGATGEYLYFEINTTQAEDIRSNLKIRNEAGNELFAETLFKKSATRKIKVAKGDVEKLEVVYNTFRGEVKKVLEVKIKFQEAIEVTDLTASKL
ncbi:MAG: hypothetical protein K2P88_09150 [Chitinophagaceae bacterium]|uniref:hypothetical protein n=1 Tax=unclassified Paraflavitalea TaxID=2798305 RepID=UPI003D343F71|nr:hypothetical protein [Chitinophagaceae bacterium]